MLRESAVATTYEFFATEDQMQELFEWFNGKEGAPYVARGAHVLGSIEEGEGNRENALIQNYTYHGSTKSPILRFQTREPAKFDSFPEKCLLVINTDRQSSQDGIEKVLELFARFGIKLGGKER